MTALYKFCWVLWIGGTILIVASWGDIVTPTVGWIGFGVALAGTLFSIVAQQSPRKGQRTRPEERELGAERFPPPDGPHD